MGNAARRRIRRLACLIVIPALLVLGVAAASPAVAESTNQPFIALTGSDGGAALPHAPQEDSCAAGVFRCAWYGDLDGNQSAASWTYLITNNNATFVYVRVRAGYSGVGTVIDEPKIAFTNWNGAALPHCANEDGSGTAKPCAWYGDLDGNGYGSTYVVTCSTGSPGCYTYARRRVG